MPLALSHCGTVAPAVGSMASLMACISEYIHCGTVAFFLHCGTAALLVLLPVVRLAVPVGYGMA